jgi:hypothetical protein
LDSSFRHVLVELAKACGLSGALRAMAKRKYLEISHLELARELARSLH